MKKVIALISVLVAAAVVFCACSGQTGNETPAVKAEINIGLLKGPTGMGCVKLLEDNENGEAAANYGLTLAGAPDVLVSSLIDGSLDICALPANTAAALYAKTQGKVKMLAVNTLGVIYILSSDPSVKSIADLKNGKIVSAGQGTTTEYVLDRVLSANGIDPDKDIETEYLAEHAEVVANALSGKADTVLLPEPFVTQLLMKSDAFNKAIDLTAEWKKCEGTELTMGCIAVRSEFAENEPEAVEAFLSDYEKSVAFVNENTAGAAALTEKFEIAPAAVAEKAIPGCNIVFMKGDEMKDNAGAYLSAIFATDPASVGGSLPAGDFWFGADE